MIAPKLRSPSFLVLLSLGIGSLGCGAGAQNTAGSRAPAEVRASYTWESPNGWRGGSFMSPPDFAPDLGIVGREVLRFSPGYYQQEAHDFWTYTFAFVLDSDANVSDDFVESELATYFRGLGANLGDRARAELSSSDIEVTRLQGRRLWRRARVRAFDSWETGRAIELNVEWSARHCEGGAHQVLLFKVSPLAFEDAAWGQLDAEEEAFHCR